MFDDKREVNSTFCVVKSPRTILIVELFTLIAVKDCDCGCGCVGEGGGAARSSKLTVRELGTTTSVWLVRS